jgi:sec-independent protein translocase protein TatB
MFDIGWSELLVIAVVAIIVMGPKELPRLMRTFGHYTGKLRRAAGEFQRQFEDAVRESELDEVRKALHDVRDTSADLSTSIDKPLMTAKPPAAAAGPSTLPPAPAAAAKPKRKTSAKSAAEQPKSGAAKPKSATVKPKAAAAKTKPAAAKARKSKDAKP